MATARRRRAGQNFRPVMPQPSDMSRLTIGPGQKKKTDSPSNFFLVGLDLQLPLGGLAAAPPVPSGGPWSSSSPFRTLVGCSSTGRSKESCA